MLKNQRAKWQRGILRRRRGSVGNHNAAGVIAVATSRAAVACVCSGCARAGTNGVGGTRSGGGGGVSVE